MGIVETIFGKKEVEEKIEDNIIEDDNVDIEDTPEDTENINTDAEEISLDDDIDSDIELDEDESDEEVEVKSKFVLDEKTEKPFIYNGKKVLKKYKEGKFTVIETEDGATYKNIS